MLALHFHGFQIHPAERQVTVRGEAVKLSGRAFDLLMALVEGRDRVIRKDALLEAVWPGLVVEENNLQVHISQLRKQLGAKAISTVPGRGYQFTARSIDPDDSDDAEGKQWGSGLDNDVLSDATQGNLPAALAPLFGREAEIAELSAMLGRVRLMTITGAGGIGKTRIALAVGQHMLSGLAHGVWLVELAPLSDPKTVVSEIAQTLGISLNSGKSTTQRLIDALGGRSALIILDNCEHLLEAVADVAQRMVSNLPLLRVLVTSQELLKLEDEQVYKLNPLDLPKSTEMADVLASGAIQLLMARAQSVHRKFQLTPDTVADAVDICRHLDGVPLAIELAASRIPMLGIVGVRQRLGEMFRLLTGDARVRLRRHQTLRATLDWSYQLLDAREQALLCRLGVFAGGFCIEGAQSIAADLFADDWDVLDTLATLVDKSLVQVSGQDKPRYTLLETTRAYAMEQLAAAGQTDAGLALHAKATRLVCERAAKRRDIDMIWQEMANVRAAFSWSVRSRQDNETAVALATMSSVVLAVAGLVGEALERLLQVEHMVDANLPVALAAQYWQWLGRCGIDGRLATHKCLMAFEKAESLYRGLSNRRHVHACMRMRAEALLEFGDLEAAQLALHDAYALEQSGWTVADRMRRMRVQGLVHDAAGRYEQALQLIGDALLMATSNDIRRYAVTLANDLAGVQLHMGDAPAAQAGLANLIVQISAEPSQGLTLSYARIRYAIALLMQDQVADSVAAALASVRPLERSGILIARSDLFAWVLAACGRVEEACMLLGAADAFRSQRQLEPDATERRARDASLKIIANTVNQPTIDSCRLRGSELSETATANLLASVLATHVGAEHPLQVNGLDP